MPDLYVCPCWCPTRSSVKESWNRDLMSSINNCFFLLSVGLQLKFIFNFSCFVDESSSSLVCKLSEICFDCQKMRKESGIRYSVLLKN